MSVPAEDSRNGGEAMLRVRRFFEYMALLAALALTIDVWISVGLTCQKIGNNSPSAYYSEEECRFFDGPIVAGLNWLTREAEENQSATDAALRWLTGLMNFRLTDVLLVLFAYLLAMKTGGLFRETAALRTAADQQASDMKAAIVEARRSADAARDSADALIAALSTATAPATARLAGRVQLEDIKRSPPSLVGLDLHR
jgi:hypothetical protein